jgi:hypothetical protein
LNENYQIGSLVVGSSKHHEIISSEKQDWVGKCSVRDDDSLDAFYPFQMVKMLREHQRNDSQVNFRQMILNRSPDLSGIFWKIELSVIRVDTICRWYEEISWDSFDEELLFVWLLWLIEHCVYLFWFPISNGIESTDWTWVDHQFAFHILWDCWFCGKWKKVRWKVRDREWMISNIKWSFVSDDDDSITESFCLSKKEDVRI